MTSDGHVLPYSRWSLDGNDECIVTSLANTQSTMPTNTGSTIRAGLHGQGPLQVALLGDSFTHGACVPREASVAGRVRAAFPATLNLGIDDTGPLHQLGIFREYAVSLEPQFVVWNWFEGNDLRDLRRNLIWAPLRAYLRTNAPFGLRNRQADIDRTLRVVINAEIILKRCGNEVKTE